jgi:type IV pilus biogenesis protein CpaD/CtpE
MQRALGPLLLALLLGGCASNRHEPAYTVAQVEQAFAAQGIPLHEVALNASLSSSPTELTGRQIADRLRVVLYVYPKARASYVYAFGSSGSVPVITKKRNLVVAQFGVGPEVGRALRSLP